MPLAGVSCGAPASVDRIFRSGILVAGDWNISDEELVLAEQTSVLERLEVRQVAEGIEPEAEQKRRRGDVGIGRPRLRAARPRRDHVRPAQVADLVTADLAVGTFLVMSISVILFITS